MGITRRNFVKLGAAAILSAMSGCVDKELERKYNESSYIVNATVRGKLPWDGGYVIHTEEDRFFIDPAKKSMGEELKLGKNYRFLIDGTHKTSCPENSMYLCDYRIIEDVIEPK